MLPVKKSQSWLPSIFTDLFGNEWVAQFNKAMPAVNIIENETSFNVEIAAPGMEKKDVKICVENDNELSISMEKKTETKEEDKAKKGRYLRREFSQTQFQQSLILPDNVEKDKIEATVKNGVLEITIPKLKESERKAVAKPKEITVK